MSQYVVYNIQRMSTEDGPGLRTTVFLKGCPLRCLWCSNPESQSFTPQLMLFENLCTSCGRCMEVCPHRAVIKIGDAYNRDLELCTDCGMCVPECPSKARVLSGEMMDVSKVMEIVRKDSLFYANSGGGITIGGGEPTLAGEFVLDLLRTCQSEGLHTCVDTCGFCPPEQFQKVIELSDLLLFDCKHMLPQEHKQLTGHDNRIILTNLRAALESHAQVHIRIPLIPDLNDSEENVANLAIFLHKFGINRVYILPYHAFGRNKFLALRREYPRLETYTPEGLREVLTRFAQHGLQAEVV